MDGKNGNEINQDTIDSRPSINLLNRHIREPVCAVSSHAWKDLGRELLSKENYNALDIISNENANLMNCCSAMFRLWLERQPERANWRQLMEALKKLQLNHLAGEIESKLIKPDSEPCPDNETTHNEKEKHPTIQVDSMADSQSVEPKVDIEISIDGEIYELDKIPPDGSGVVIAAKKRLQKTINLKDLVTDLGRIGKFIRVAYYGVGAAGYEYTEEQIKIQRLGYDITKLCDKSALTVEKFEEASNTVLIDLQCTYEYLLDNLEYMALETLSSVSKLAGEMEKAAMEMHKDFEEQGEKVVEALENTQKAKEVQAQNVKEEKEKQIKLKEAMKREQELIKEHQEKEDEAEARRRSLELQEDEAISEIGLSTMKELVNAFTTTIVRIKAFDTKVAEKKAAIIRQNRLEALEREKAIRETRHKALANMSEFAAKVKQCSNDQEMAECAVEALHETIGALKHISVVMMKVAHFWKKMKDHCQLLAESEMKSLVEKAMKEDKKERLKVWSSRGFKRKAILFYSVWRALNKLCADNVEQINATRQDLYKCITENPTHEECKRNIPSIAEKFMAELKRDQNALAENDLEAQKEMAMLTLKEK